MSYHHGKLILQSTCSVILRMYKLLQLQHAFWRPSFNVSWTIVLFIWWKHVSDFQKHNFETYRFLKQQIMILFSGTLKWNMFQIHLKEMHPWSWIRTCTQVTKCGMLDTSAPWQFGIRTLRHLCEKFRHPDNSTRVFFFDFRYNTSNSLDSDVLISVF